MTANTLSQRWSALLSSLSIGPPPAHQRRLVGQGCRTELGPDLLHDVRSHVAINQGNSHTASISTASSIEELRTEDRTHRIVTVDEAFSMIKAGTPLPLQPLVGGLPPEIAWRHLRTVTDEVMPRL
ncbi:MAG: hypothetical protein ABSB68_08825 [Acidimicrobiales bacterium]